MYSGAFTPEDRAAWPYSYLTFDMPAGCPGLTVELAYDASAGVLDLGCFGGLLSINHPLTSDFAWRQPLITRPSLAEMWHWTWLDRRWGGPMAW